MISLMRHAARTFDPLALLDSLLFHQRIQRLEERQSDDSLVNEDGTRGSPGATNCPATSSSARAWMRPGPSRTSLRRGAASAVERRLGFPVPGQGQGGAEVPFAQSRDAGRAPSSQPIRFSDPSHLRLPKFGPLKLFGPTRKVRRMIDAGRFHVYSATLTQRAGRWTVSLTGVAAELHQAERSRTKRHAIPVGVDRGIISLCVAADANGVSIESFEG